MVQFSSQKVKKMEAYKENKRMLYKQTFIYFCLFMYHRNQREKD